MLRNFQTSAPNAERPRRISRGALVGLLLVTGLVADTAANDGRVTGAVVGTIGQLGTRNDTKPPSGDTGGKAGAASKEDAQSFDRLSKKLGGKASLAWAPVGTDSSVTSVGNFQGGPAWSTIKIPIAIAVLKSGADSENARQDMQLAITQSDNPAARRLWDRLGDPAEAAKQTRAIIREAGDDTTRVQSEVTRPEYSAYGQTKWTVADQAGFAAALPCMEDAKPILKLMGNVTESQQWGMGAVDDTARIKGGWGQNKALNYQVRQMAVVTLPDDSRIGLAMASQPADGTYESGVDNLNQIARWALKNISDTGAGEC